MVSLVVQIERLVDDDFPRFVGCSLIDADGARHDFVEKVPMVSASDLRAESHYPQSRCIDCTIEDEWIGESGKAIVRVSTEKPWSVASITGITEFIVLKDQVIFD